MMWKSASESVICLSNHSHWRSPWMSASCVSVHQPRGHTQNQRTREASIGLKLPNTGIPRNHAPVEGMTWRGRCVRGSRRMTRTSIRTYSITHTHHTQIIIQVVPSLTVIVTNCLANPVAFPRINKRWVGGGLTPPLFCPRHSNTGGLI